MSDTTPRSVSITASGWLMAHWTPAKALISYGGDVVGNVASFTHPTKPSVSAVYDAL